ncbi:MAG: hypothetical protein SFW35_01075 [Chitinophagales bacterium]|nr:hypothetical protein [Chitinophagales bacterium]
MTRQPILFLLLCISISSYGQVPGFMGKKFYIKYDFDIQPNILTIGNKGSSIFDIDHNAGVEYTISKSIVLGLSYGYGKYKTLYSGYYREFDGFRYNDIDYDEVGYATVHTVRFDSKFFLSGLGHIAPRGLYFLTGLSFNSIRPSLADNLNELKLPDVDFSRYYDVAIHVGLGRQFIVGNRIVLNYAVDCAIPSFRGVGADDSVEERGIQALTNANYGQIRLGIGFLAF